MSNAVMIFKLLAVVHISIVLTSAKECNPGQNCELKCCTIPEGDVLCRARCLGLSCELDAHCDGDCCVETKCTNCPSKRLVIVNAPTIFSLYYMVNKKSRVDLFQIQWSGKRT